ncbi:FYVE-type domain-containing protein [Aphelenchoides besseyi]|nr:FYVE-type domain-containing protein [Aphelenchoides besseyi]
MPCTNCMTNYSLFNREDGCSNCGYGFCKKCLTKKHLLPRLSNKPVPVCDSCYTTLTKGPLEKSRNESSTKNDGKWWDDDKPPPSMRQQYSIKPKLVNKPQSKPKHDDESLVARLANLTGRSVDEIKNPRFMVSDKDSAEIPSTSTEILANLRPSENVESLINNKFASNEDDKLARELKLPIVPPAEDSIEGLEERLAALRNVPVDVIRKPRTMVVNESESESELDDDAKELLERAEQRLRKKEPDLFACYQNEGLNSSSDEETKQKPNKKES